MINQMLRSFLTTASDHHAGTASVPGGRAFLTALESHLGSALGYKVPNPEPRADARRDVYEVGPARLIPAKKSPRADGVTAVRYVYPVGMPCVIPEKLTAAKVATHLLPTC